MLVTLQAERRKLWILQQRPDEPCAKLESRMQEREVQFAASSVAVIRKKNEQVAARVESLEQTRECAAAGHARQQRQLALLSGTRICR